MKFEPTPLAGSYIVTPSPIKDERGTFSRCFCAEEFNELGLNSDWAQINISTNHRKGTLRGLHLQLPPNAEVKLVRCIRGSVWDVLVDLRAGSPTYGKWFGAVLSSSNNKMFYVPRGFAHGFVTQQDNSELMYLISAPYAPTSEVTLLWRDQVLGVEWPVEPSLISAKDERGLALSDISPVSV